MDFTLPTDEPEPKKPRKRGGQAGNFNARKHGFYTKQLQIGKHLSPSPQDLSNLSSEIFKMRQFLDQVFSIIPPDISLAQAIESLRALSLASSAISRLYAIQFSLLDFKTIEIKDWEEQKKLEGKISDEDVIACLEKIQEGLPIAKNFKELGLY